MATKPIRSIGDIPGVHIGPTLDPAAEWWLQTPPPDGTAPVIAGTLSAVAGNGSVTLSGPTATDNVGIAKWQYRIDLGAWVDIPSSALGTMPSTVVSGLTNGTAYTFGVRALDAANNASAILSASATPSIAPVNVTVTALGKWFDTLFAGGAETADLTVSLSGTGARTNNADNLRLTDNTTATDTAWVRSTAPLAHSGTIPRFLIRMDARSASLSAVAIAAGHWLKLIQKATAPVVGPIAGADQGVNPRVTVEITDTAAGAGTYAGAVTYYKNSSNAWTEMGTGMAAATQHVGRLVGWMWCDGTTIRTCVQNQSTGAVLASASIAASSVYTTADPWWVIFGDAATDWPTGAAVDNYWFGATALKDTRLKVTGLTTGQIVRLYDSTNTTLIGKTDGTAGGTGVAYIECASITSAADVPVAFAGGGKSMVLRRYASDGTTLVSTSNAFTAYAGDSVAF